MKFNRCILATVCCCMCVTIVSAQDPQQETSNQICPNGLVGDDSYKFIQMTDKCEEASEENSLKRMFLSGNVTCNDGTPAGFYIRKSEGSKRWIMYLEGGWYCYDEPSCINRWSRVRYLMSSEHWSPYRSGFGILSNNAQENPYWWHANHVFVPYCTSDIWSGRRPGPSRHSSFSFMGAQIVKQVVKELLHLGLEDANTLILAGSSAGGIGVMLNLETVQRLLSRHGSKVKVQGITDSGWFLDQLSAADSFDIEGIVTPVQTAKRGSSFWKSHIPRSCRMAYPTELWKCFIGYRIYPTLSAPLFVFQWLFDEVQLHTENIGTPITKPQWEYIHKMGNVLRNSFHNVTSVFVPSCISHSILMRRDWHTIRIDDITLPHALHCWERQTKNLAHKKQFIYDRSRDAVFLNTSNDIKRREMDQLDNLPVIKSKQNNKRRRRMRNRNCKNRKKHNGHRKQKLNRQMRNQDATACPQKLIERCSWPQCNNYCPKLQNPITGEELDFLELLQSFGLDMKNVASALGIDIHTLNNMSQGELINLLTQQTS